MPNFCPLFTNAATWIAGIIAGIGGLILLIDMARHAMSDRRDYRTAGLEALGLVALIVLGTKGAAIITTALGWMGSPGGCGGATAWQPLDLPFLLATLRAVTV